MALSIDPGLLARTYRRPVAFSGLIVDLVPVFAVVFLGWGAAALVFLYWLENLIIGLMTIARLLVTGFRTGGAGGPLGAAFMAGFFTVHYGLFCLVHGVFLQVLAMNPFDDAGESNPDIVPAFSPLGTIDFALGLAPAMGTIALILLAWHAFATVEDLRSEGPASRDDPQLMGQTMAAPYGRIVILHIGLFIGLGGLIALGEPIWGVLALILLDVAWGIFLTLRRAARDAG